ncbi:large conductance mechanosensitive channel [Streptohalobacillus salinus]|uniref:Large-conductance mechanosensitive channel n=1 Tax=Streptohalobacillus salinus TaxID=621096 RepID=A0A2V3W9L0_9BACI|nr:large-conductance mechanosensitive channel protein MscL [Streptohalobacillus salinus]PXW91057.1 large conductance mechanosensitive channel [Streptohalobacillus salinus]
MSNYLKEFKAFALRGNVLDLAIAVIIGAAFNAIVQSFVHDMVMPIIAAIFGAPDFSAITVTINQTPIMVGLFIQAVVNFLIVAFVIFSVVHLLTKLKKKEAEKPAAPILPTKEEELLTEIRDLLKTN